MRMEFLVNRTRLSSSDIHHDRNTTELPARAGHCYGKYSTVYQAHFIDQGMHSWNWKDKI